MRRLTFTILAVSTEQNLVTSAAPKIWRDYVFLQTGVRYSSGGETAVARYYVYVFDRVNVKDINSVWGSADYPNTPPPSQLGFGTPRDVFNPRQLQFGLKLRF